MASGTANATDKSTSSAASRNEQYIQAQLDRTRVNVKLVDLFGGLMIVTAGVLGFLLAAAILDAWVLELSTGGRLVALLVLVGGGAAYFTRLVLPLLIRRINPAYAARAIEESQPGLKNSLINFLMMRAHREEENEVVYQAVQQRAAVDLSHVPIESAVDRTKLIRIGYVLAGIVLVCGLYKIVSPKDPFQTVTRIAMPFADVQAPSRVQIGEVDPADVDVFFGDTLSVSATVYGTDNGEPVTLVYSSTDGQIVDRRVPMTSSEGSSTYKCLLSPGPAGIQQDLAYRLVAGDAATRSYQVKVKTAPSIVVRELKYEYPPYTRRAERAVEGQADIRELEGTQVTITAEANLPIKSARLELNVAVTGEENSTTSAQPTTVPMQVSGRQATGQITLELRADGKTPVHGNYRVRFQTEDELQSENAPVNSIEVSRDLAPEVHILEPTSERIELDRFDTQTIEVRALDPDYAIGQLKLRGVAGGADLFHHLLFKQASLADTAASVLSADVPLLPLDPVLELIAAEFAGGLGQSAEPRQQVVANFEFCPADYGLRAGDEIVFWASVEDNRTSALHQLPEPNSARTANHLIVVTERSVSARDDAVADNGSDRKDPQTENSTGDETSEDGRSGESSGGGASADGAAGAEDEGASESSGAGTSGNAKDGGASQPEDMTSRDSGGSGTASESSGGSASDSSASPADGGEPSDGAGGTPQATGSDSVGTGGPEGAADPREPMPGESGEGAGQRSADEPAHDGEAFERLVELAEELQRQSQKQDDGGASRDPASGTPAGQADDKTSDRNETSDGDPTGDSNTEGAGEKSQRDGSPMNQSGSIEPGETLGETESEPQLDKTGGQGGVPQGSEETRKDDGEGGRKSDQDKGPGEGDGGQSGAGTDTGSETGSPPGQTRNQDRPKKKDPRGGGTDLGEQPKSPTNSDRQSDSESDTAGDKSGGGAEGGGQGANREGNDSSGSNSAGDFGSGAAPEKGGGETASGGADQLADDNTGTGSNEAGNGSASRQNPEGDTTADRTGEATGSESRNSPFGGSGGTADGTSPSSYDADEVPAGEKANLEYSRKATDLALEYLKEQEDKHNQLADELGWTEEELRDFVKRWKTMKRQAKEGDLGARRELDRALRSLGLRPADDTRRAATTRDDALRGLRDSGLRSNPPSKYLDQFNAFIKGTASADSSGSDD